MVTRGRILAYVGMAVAWAGTVGGLLWWLPPSADAERLLRITPFASLKPGAPIVAELLNPGKTATTVNVRAIGTVHRECKAVKTTKVFQIVRDDERGVDLILIDPVREKIEHLEAGLTHADTAFTIGIVIEPALQRGDYRIEVEAMCLGDATSLRFITPRFTIYPRGYEGNTEGGGE